MDNRTKEEDIEYRSVLTLDVFDTLYEEAYRRFNRRPAVSGQAITHLDDISYWVALVVEEYVRKYVHS